MNSPLQYDEFIETLESFASNSTAVGIDGISYQMLNHLPDSWKQLLHTYYQKRNWLNETLPSIWKQYVIIPILEQGTPKSAIASYRPTALTSHAGKIMEKIIFKQLLHYCERKKKEEGIIPVNQTGFRKGRCTTDHLVKLTSHIKNSFRGGKSTLATLSDVKKAYDSVRHARLIYKLENISITGMMFQYFKNFLFERCICPRVGKTYSSNKTIDMGIPQGSIIAPILFNIIIHDLPKVLSNNTHVAQYADDTAIWVKITLRKHTSKRVVNHVQKLYQSEINKLTA